MLACWQGELLGLVAAATIVRLINNLNNLIKGIPNEGKSLEDIIKTAPSGGLFNNAAQHFNHSFYWKSLAPKAGGQPKGAVADAIKSGFGSFDEFKKKFTDAATTHFGSGWAWLVRKPDGSLAIEATHDAGTPLTSGNKPILTCDVWEHAYYIDYRNARPRYLEAFWNLANWEFAWSLCASLFRGRGIKIRGMEKLEGKVAIITGGTGALGRAAVDNFLTAGARVAVPWIVEAEVPLLRERLGNRFPNDQLMLARVNIGDEAEAARFVESVAKRFGRIDILTNLVGGFWGGKPISETTAAEWQAMFDLNLKPTFLMCRAVAPLMQKNKYGRIVSVTSRSGLTGAGDFAAYAVAKGAIATFTSSLAEELLADNVLVNAIAPSTIDTEANRKAMPKAKHENWVKPEDIAATLAYLCSQDCRVTSGAVVPVYGRA